MTLPGRKFSAWAAVALAAALFLALNVLSQATLRTARLDLTEGRLYTLSGGTRAMLESMAEPITVRFFFSESLAADLPGFRQYAQRVRELLETYAARAGGAMALQVIDPEPFSPAEDEAVALGLRGVPLTEQGERLYFGMAATNTTDDLEVVPFFQDAREAFLEYDLTRAFYRLANPKRPVVGLVSTLPVDGGFDPQRGAQPAWTVAEQIRQLFELRDLTTEVSEVPEDVDVLMVVPPEGPSGRDPLRHRPVRAGRRQGDGVRRPVLGGGGGDPRPREPHAAAQFAPARPVRGLGGGARSGNDRRRPADGAQGARRHAGTAGGGRLHRLAGARRGQFRPREHRHRAARRDQRRHRRRAQPRRRRVDRIHAADPVVGRGDAVRAHARPVHARPGAAAGRLRRHRRVLRHGGARLRPGGNGVPRRPAAARRRFGGERPGGGGRRGRGLRAGASRRPPRRLRRPHQRPRRRRFGPSSRIASGCRPATSSART